MNTLNNNDEKEQAEEKLLQHKTRPKYPITEIHTQDEKEINEDESSHTQDEEETSEGEDSCFHEPLLLVKDETEKRVKEIHIYINCIHNSKFISEQINIWKKEIKQVTLNDNFNDFTCSIYMGDHYDDDSSNWFDDIPDQLLDFLLTIQHKITFLDMDFDPFIKKYIDLNIPTTGSNNLDKLFEIITHTSNLQRLRINLCSSQTRIGYSKQQSITLLNKWLDYMFCFENGFNSVVDFSLRLNIYYQKDNSKVKSIKLTNLLNFIQHHPSIKKLTIIEDSDNIPLIELWYPLLDCIKLNKRIETLCITTIYPDIDEIMKLRRSHCALQEQFQWKIESSFEERQCEYSRKLKKIAAIIWEKNVSVIDIDFDNRYGFGGKASDCILMPENPIELYSIINNENIHKLKIGAKFKQIPSQKVYSPWWEILPDSRKVLYIIILKIQIVYTMVLLNYFSC